LVDKYFLNTYDSQHKKTINSSGSIQMRLCENCLKRQETTAPYKIKASAKAEASLFSGLVNHAAGYCAYLIASHKPLKKHRVQFLNSDFVLK